MRQVALFFVTLIATAAIAVGEVNADLLRAAREGDAETVKDLLSKHGSEIAKANSGFGAIKATAEQGHVEIIKALLGSPNVDDKRAIGTAVSVSAMHGYIETVRVLIRESGDPQLANKALAGAVAGERVDLAHMLLTEGADANVVPAEGPSPPGATLLAMKAGDGAIEIVNLLLAWGANPNVATKDGGTPLMAVAGHGRVETMRSLLNAGAEVNATVNKGQSVLDFAIMTRRIESARVLLAAGANTELVDKNGRTPLMNVAATSNTSILRLLLEWDADVNATDSEGRTPLIDAAAFGRLYNVKALLAAKPDIEARDKQGRTAIDHARERKREDIAEVIEAARDG